MPTITGASILAQRYDTPQKRAALAKRIGVNRLTVWRWTEGRQTPPLKLAFKLEDVTGIPARAWTL
jgi:DNA-binding XRE family transcriptional regulator